MSPSPTAYAVIVAGGSGVRMGASTPKQFLPLAGKPVLYWSIRAFQESFKHVRIIVVLPEAYGQEGRDVLALFTNGLNAVIVPGGATRYASVAAGLQAVPDVGTVMVHDAARPMVTPDLIRRCYEATRIHGSAIPVTAVADSIRQISGYLSRSVTREDLRIVQTPQAFDAGAIKAAFQQPYLPMFTDEASVLEWSGKPVHLVDGERSNFKLTTQEDLTIAEALMNVRLRG